MLTRACRFSPVSARTEVHRHSGAKEDKFEESILQFLPDKTLPPLP